MGDKFKIIVIIIAMMVVAGDLAHIENKGIQPSLELSIA